MQLDIPYHLENYIGGNLIGPLSGKFLDNTNPATGKVYGQIPDSNEKDIEVAVHAAQKAFPSWSTTSLEKRFIILNKIAELIDENSVISEVQDMLDIIGECGFNSCNRIILKEENLNPDFFRLHTGLAGEILQKFSTYGFKLAIIGNFSKYRSKSLQDFIRESNKGRSIFFVNSFDDALARMTRL